jgi:hypothetical protein
MCTSYVPVMHCEKMAVTDMSFRQCALIEFLVKEVNSAEVIYEGGWNILRTETLTSAISRAVVDRELLQLSATSPTSSSDKTEGHQRNCSGAPCGPGDGDFGISGNLCELSCLSSYVYRVRKCWKCCPIHPTVRIWPPQTTTCSDLDLSPETDEAVQEVVRSWLRGAGTDFYRSSDRNA